MIEPITDDELQKLKAEIGERWLGNVVKQSPIPSLIARIEAGQMAFAELQADYGVSRADKNDLAIRHESALKIGATLHSENEALKARVKELEGLHEAHQIRRQVTTHDLERMEAELAQYKEGFAALKRLVAILHYAHKTSDEAFLYIAEIGEKMP